MADLLRHFEAYAWPGNVRELRNAVARRTALGELAGPGGPEASAATPSHASPGAGWADDILALDNTP
jgi:DNA-binding NtrC family response regulator